MLYAGSPRLTNCSISSLKGCRCSSEEALHTFSISEVHTGKKKTRERQEQKEEGQAGVKTQRNRAVMIGSSRQRSIGFYISVPFLSRTLRNDSERYDVNNQTYMLKYQESGKERFTEEESKKKTFSEHAFLSLHKNSGSFFRLVSMIPAADQVFLSPLPNRWLY